MRLFITLIAFLFVIFPAFSQVSTVYINAEIPNNCDHFTRVRFYQPGTTILEFEAFYLLNANEQLVITGVPSGNFDLFIRPNYHLQKGIPGVAITDGITLDLGVFNHGDINADNQINILDLSILLSAYASVSEEANYLSSADINCDGEINIIDVSHFLTYYGTEGDEPPLESTGTGPQYPAGSVHCIPGGAEVVEVINPATGRTWMDRNLGASQVATAVDDELAYGDLYQWGRFSDGHQCRDSETTDILSNSPQPDHGDFIIVNNTPNDWLSPQNDNLWQGVNGVNNPCPEGFRIPTNSELEQERLSWDNNDRNGAFNSPLKFTAAGTRNSSDIFVTVNTWGYYSSSDVTGTSNNVLGITPDNAYVTFGFRGAGRSVRCIKDESASSWDCPELELNIGDSCNDGNPETSDDVITAECECEGTYDCPTLEANIGDSCNDGNPETSDDVITADCECEGTYDCPALEANIGDSCDDGDPLTEDDIIGSDCQCEGTPVIVSFNLSTNFDCSRGIWVGIYEPGTSNMVDESSGNLDSEGAYTIDGLATGTYDLYIRVDGFLQKLNENVEITPSSNSVELSGLLAGDINGDNTVGPLDLSLFLSAYNSGSGEPDYDLNSDFDCNGNIGPLDLSQLLSNYNLVGQEP